MLYPISNGLECSVLKERCKLTPRDPPYMTLNTIEYQHTRIPDLIKRRTRSVASQSVRTPTLAEILHNNNGATAQQQNHTPTAEVPGTRTEIPRKTSLNVGARTTPLTAAVIPITKLNIPKEDAVFVSLQPHPKGVWCWASWPRTRCCSWDNRPLKLDLSWLSAATQLWYKRHGDQ